MPPYTKPYLSVPDQLGLLKSRGLQVANDVDAADCLRRNGYYRLSAYWYPFREIAGGIRTDRFLPGSQFEDAQRLYLFDKALKLLLLDGLECVEIAARVAVALELGQRDTFAHERPALFHPNFTRTVAGPRRSGYDKWIEKFRQRVTESRDEFVLHHEHQYGSRSPLPIWIAIELWDFGLLSHAFSGMRVADQSSVAARFSVPNRLLMESWLRSLNYVRNVIAHHGRLWNLSLNVNPAPPRIGEIQEFDSFLTWRRSWTRIFSICAILCYFTRVINPQSPWIRQLKDLVSDFPAMPYATVHDMGFQPGWEAHALWTA